jgi:hypothetical protein
MTAQGPEIRHSSRHRQIRPAWRVSRCSSSMMQDVVNDEVVSRTTKMSCLCLLITSAANETRTAAGGSDVDCSTNWLGIFFSEAHKWHDLRIDPRPCQGLRRRSSRGRLALTGGGKGG